MKKNAIIIGSGTQGIKRLKYVKKYFNFKGYVDPLSNLAKYKNIKEVPTKIYDVAFLCLPDNSKKDVIDFLVKEKKHMLVEKPLILSSKEYHHIEDQANKNNLYIYTAYNHRFEQHIINLKRLLQKKKLGKIYTIDIFYGNGTAKLVKKSNWKNKGDGVISDLGSHLLDIISFLFPKKKINYKITYKNKYETKSFDHAAIFSEKKNNKDINIFLEMSYLSWKNTFELNCIGEKGSAHINSLCKWGPSYFTIRKRKLPSGYPKEKVKKIISKDITWDKETKFFLSQINKKIKTNFSNDKSISIQIKKILNRL